MADSFPRTERFLNRELSWLEFNARVLALAEDPSNRLLERVKFFAIFSSNLDEFFQVRVAGLQEQREAGVGPASPEGLTPEEQLDGITERVTELYRRTDASWTKDLRPALEKEGVRLVDWSELDDRDRVHLEALFSRADLPGTDPAVRRPRAPVPLHLLPLAQPRGPRS